MHSAGFTQGVLSLRFREKAKLPRDKLEYRKDKEKDVAEVP